MPWAPNAVGNIFNAPAQQQGGGGIFGMAPGQMNYALTLAGLGLLGGQGRSGQIKGAAEGLMAGSQMDLANRTRDEQRRREEEQRSALDQALKTQEGISPEIGRLLSTSPDAATKYLLDRMTPPEPDWLSERALQQQMQLRSAGRASTNVNVGGEENAYAKEVGKAFAQNYIEMQQGAQQASTMVGKLDRLEQALSAPGVYTGTGGEAVAKVKKAAQSFGFEVEGVADTDVAQSISNEITLQLRNPAGGAGMPGAMSDKDREFLRSIPPSLGDSPEGVKQKIEQLRRVNKRSVEVANFANEYVRQNGQIDGQFYSELATWAEANPLFPDAALRGSGAPPAAALLPRDDTRWSVIDGVRVRELP